MKLRPATAEEIERWDELIVANPDGGHIMQSKVWGEFKTKYSWQAQYYVYEAGSRQIATLFLTRKAPGLGTVWYAPKGPGVTSEAQLLEVAKASDALAGLVVKFEPEIDELDVKPENLAKAGLVRAKNVQFKATIIVDLTPGEDELLASFKQKTRYNIRLAAKRGVTVSPVPATEENLHVMYELVKATQDRAGYFVRGREYLFDYWKAEAEAGLGQLFFASFEGKTLAGAYAQVLGSHGWYKDGGSIREHQELMAPYALQWEIMRWLKQRQVESYDMVGVPPRDQLGKGHILDSLFQFKSGFSQDHRDFIGAYDLPLSPKYPLWAKLGERASVAYQSKVKKDYFY